MSKNANSKANKLGLWSRDGVQTYYHHTDKDSAKKIIKSGVNKQSTDTVNDAVRGVGAYVTKLGPDSSRRDIAKNNYDGHSNFYKSKIEDGKTDVVFQVSLPAKNVTDHTDLGRDVHTHKGDIRLNETTDWKLHVRKTGSDQYTTKTPKH